MISGGPINSEHRLAEIDTLLVEGLSHDEAKVRYSSRDVQRLMFRAYRQVTPLGAGTAIPG
jgi:hypothetical protein